MRNAFFVGLIILAGMVVIVPAPASAAAPTFDCEFLLEPGNVSGGYKHYDFIGSALASTGSPQSKAAIASKAGSLTALYDAIHFADTSVDSIGIGINTACQAFYSSANICPAQTSHTFDCHRSALGNDPAGFLGSIGASRDNGVVSGRTWAHFNGDTTGGELSSSSPPALASGTCSSPAAANLYPLSGDGYYDATAGAIRYLLVTPCSTSTASTIDIVDDTATVVAHYQSPSAGNLQLWDATVPGNGTTYFAATGIQSATAIWYGKQNLADGTNAATQLTDFRCGAGTEEAPHQSTTHPGDFYVLVDTNSNCASNQLYGFTRINGAAWTRTETGINFGSGTNTALFGVANIAPSAWALDGHDDFLLSGNDGQCHLAKADTITPFTVEWNVAFHAGGFTGENTQCLGVAFDYNAGFYTWGSYTVPSGHGASSGQRAIFVRHYTGGGFTQPAVNPGTGNVGNLYATPRAPAGLTGSVTTGWTGTTSTVVLRWPVSVDDPNQIQGSLTYKLYINGAFIAQDPVTSQDAGGIRYMSLTVVGTQPTGQALYWVTAKASGAESPPSCSITINDNNQGTTDTCGAISPGNVLCVGCGGTGSGTTPADVGTGIVAFAQSIGFVSTGSLFFFGLLLVAIGALALQAPFSAITKSVSPLPGAVGGLGMMLFNVFTGIWQPWAGVVLIILTAAVIVIAGRRLFISSDGGRSGG